MMAQSPTEFENCERCAFFIKDLCWRYPPQMVPVAIDNEHPLTYVPAEWRPTVKPSDWCGEFKDAKWKKNRE
jgi:hypothetical protein